MNDDDVGATSAIPDGRRPAWDMIWKTPVPKKALMVGYTYLLGLT